MLFLPFRPKSPDPTKYGFDFIAALNQKGTNNHPFYKVSKQVAILVNKPNYVKCIFIHYPCTKKANMCSFWNMLLLINL